MIPLSGLDRDPALALISIEVEHLRLHIAQGKRVFVSWIRRSASRGVYHASMWARRWRKFARYVKVVSWINDMVRIHALSMGWIGPFPLILGS